MFMFPCRIVLAISLLVLLVTGCERVPNTPPPLDPNPVWSTLTAAIVEDGFSPPVAGRIYAYAYLAQYEALAAGREDLPSFGVALRDCAPHVVDHEVTGDGYDASLAALAAFQFAGAELVYREFIIEDAFQAWEDSLLANGWPQDVVDHSFEVARAISDSVLAYAADDGYKRTRNMPLFEIPDDWGSWEPTPPVYGTAIEPYWDLLRPFLVDSASAYRTHYDIDYDTAVGSSFYREAMVVYDSVNVLTEDRVRQAEYWDCNPRETLASGHMMTQIKQMNPGGHWLAIGQTVMEDIDMPLDDRIRVNAVLALTIHDAFLVCWHEKYTTNLIRPETYINRHIDAGWRPILETPLFPEFTSGHSVISAASAEVLTEMVGDSIAYIDSVNFFLGLPPRSFGSFREAAAEAAMSRLYGGIHYMPAIRLGVDQGRQVAAHAMAELPIGAMEESH